MKIIFQAICLIMLCTQSYAQETFTNNGNFKMYSGCNIAVFGDFNNTGIMTSDSGVTLYDYGTLNNSGTILNNATFVYYNNSSLIYSGNVQQISGTEIPNKSGPPMVVINNINGVLLGTDALMNNVRLTLGNLNLNGRTLTLMGAITYDSGNFTGGSSANLILNGPAGSLIFDQTNSMSRTLNELTYNKANSTLLISTPLEITGVVSLLNGNISSAGNLKLKSTIKGTARVAEITGGGSVTGNVTMERFIPSSARRWRFMSSPISNTTFEDWRSEIFLTGEGIGNTLGTINSNGFDATGSNSPSVYSYDETAFGTVNYGWTSLKSISANIAVGKGYRVFIRGDRSSLERLSGVDNTQNAVTMDLIGAINSGVIPIPVSYTNSGLVNDDGWNLIGNPYPSPVDWYSLWNTGNSGNNGAQYSGISPVVFVWDAASNSYLSFNALTNTGTINKGVIASSQGFFVKATSSSPTLNFTEHFKSPDVPTQLFKTSLTDEMHIILELDSINFDHFIFKHNQAASILDDPYDINKWANPTVNISSYSQDTILHTLDARPLISDNDTIFLNIAGNEGTFDLNFLSMPADGKFYFLQDSYLHQAIPLQSGSLYPFSISLADSLSQGMNRFFIVSSDIEYLPGVFGTFTATKVGGQIQLDWNTTSEYNTSHFEIERSLDTSAFAKLGMINANYSSSTQLNYLFTDLQPSLSSLNSYRIKLLDSNGYFRYSEIRSVSFTNSISRIEVGQILLYPNPASEKIWLHVEPNIDAQYTIYIYSSKGALVQQLNSINHVSGEIEISLTGLSSGIYFVRLIDEDNKVLTAKFLLE